MNFNKVQVADKIFVRGQIFCPGVKWWTNNLSADKLFFHGAFVDELFEGEKVLQKFVKNGFKYFKRKRWQIEHLLE